MKYKLIGSNDTSNIIKTILNNRGIDDWKRYINLNKASRHTYNDLDYIARAVGIFDFHYTNNSPIAILVDNDVDGICSSTIMYKFIKALDPRYDVRMYVHQKNKSHGLDGDFNIDDDIKLLIVPDAGSNDVSEHIRLHDLGIDCICLDHHQVTVDTSNSPAIIVNNQTSDRYENKGLDFQHSLRNGFLALAEAEPERIKVINAEGSQEEVQALVMQAVTDLLEKVKA